MAGNKSDLSSFRADVASRGSRIAQRQERLRAVIEKGPASVIKVPPPEATYYIWRRGGRFPRQATTREAMVPAATLPRSGRRPRRDAGWAVQRLERQRIASVKKSHSSIHKRTALGI